MRPIFKFVMTLLLFVESCFSAEPIYNPVPLYDAKETSVVSESLYPRSVFSPSNGELYQRFESLFSSSRTEQNPSAAAEEMKNLQDKYDSWLRFLITGDENKSFETDSFTDDVLSQFEWIVETASTVEQDASLPLTVKLRNNNDKEVLIHQPIGLFTFFFISSTSLVKIDSPEQRVVIRRPSLYEYFTFVVGPGSELLEPEAIAPGGSYEMTGRGIDFDLARTYDIHEPGDYELTFYTRRFVDVDGNPAKNEVKSYPAKHSIRFTVQSKQTREARVAPLVFHYADSLEAKREMLKPTPTRTPSNAEIAARSKALAEAQGLSNTNSVFTLRKMEKNYQTSLDLLIEKTGLANPDARTEKFAGLKWRVFVPVENKSGDPILPLFGLENISEKEEYNILKKDAMNLSAIIASIRIQWYNEAKEWEETSLTTYGASFLYGYKEIVFRSMRFFGGGRLEPGSLRMTIKPLTGDSAMRDVDLTKCWDLSKPGNYRLTFYTRRFLDEDGNPAEDQVRPFPKSDVVYFNITE